MTEIIETPTSSVVEKIEIFDKNMIRVYYRSGSIEPFNVSKELIENLRLKDEKSWKIIHGFPKIKEDLKAENERLKAIISNFQDEMKELRISHNNLNKRRVELANKLEDCQSGE